MLKNLLTNFLSATQKSKIFFCDISTLSENSKYLFFLTFRAGRLVEGGRFVEGDLMEVIFHFAQC